MEPIKGPKFEMDKGKFLKGSQILTIAIAIFCYILADYIGGITDSTKFRDGWVYWLITAINLVLIIVIMLTVRSMRKEKKIKKCTDITEAINQLQRGYTKITLKGYSSKLDEYLVRVNKKNKHQTFIRAVQRKLLKLKDTPKNVEKRKELNKMLELTEDEVEKINFKYKKVTVSKLFSSLDGRIPNDNEYDMDTYEKQDIAKMVGLRSILIIAFSAFTGFIVADFIFGGWSMIYSTLLKLFCLFTAINSSMNIADDFVEHNIRTSVQRRLRCLAEFVKETPDLKAILEEDKKNKAE